VTGAIKVAGSNLKLAVPGTYSYVHTVKAMEALNFSMTLDGAPVGDSTLLNITLVLPAAVNVTRSLAAASAQRDSSGLREFWSSAGPAFVLTAHSWHLLYVPVYINGRVGSTFADPHLGARLPLSMPVT
jgi:hypothetical protein